MTTRITNVYYKRELNVVQNSELVDHCAGHFFMRTELGGIFNDSILLADLNSTLPEDSVRELNPTGRRRVVILVTKEAHYFGGLSVKANYDGLDAEIAAIIDNHDTLRSLVGRSDIPFKLISREGLNRNEHDRRMTNAINAYQSGYVMLVKYMRMLTSKFVAHFPDKIINTRHSFLSAFIDAYPYRQAYEHGVKIIDAIIHYMDGSLGKGPIVIQDAIHIDHTYTAEDTMCVGRDVEKNVLGHALYGILTRRVFVYGNQTIIP